MVSVITRRDQSYSRSGMAIAGRGARACDMCGKERARWYCTADEAYLCERCDASVHSANSVARKHDRVKLGPNGAPMKLKTSQIQHHHRSSQHSSNKIRKTNHNNITSDDIIINNSKQLLKGDIHLHELNLPESMPQLLLQDGSSTGDDIVISQQVPKVEELVGELDLEEDCDHDHQREDKIVSSILMGCGRWWRRSSKKRQAARDANYSCTNAVHHTTSASKFPMAHDQQVTHPDIQHNYMDADATARCYGSSAGRTNPVITSSSCTQMIKEEKDIILSQLHEVDHEDSILLFHSLLSPGDDMDDMGPFASPVCCNYVNNFPTTSMLRTCKDFVTGNSKQELIDLCTEQSNMNAASHHEVPTYDPLLQELDFIDDVKHDGELMQMELWTKPLPMASMCSSATSSPFCIIDSVSCCFINNSAGNKGDTIHAPSPPPSLEFSFPPAHDTAAAADRLYNSTAVAISSPGHLETHNYIQVRCADFMDDKNQNDDNGSLSMNVEEESEIDTFDMMDLCSINIIANQLEDDEDDEPLHLNAGTGNHNIQADADFQAMDSMWKPDSGEEDDDDQDLQQMAAAACKAGILDNGLIVSFQGNAFCKERSSRLVAAGNGKMSRVKIEEELSMSGESVEDEYFSGLVPAAGAGLSLRLDYEEVVNAWCDRGSLWMDGQRPQMLLLDVCLQRLGANTYGNAELYDGSMVINVNKSDGCSHINAGAGSGSEYSGELVGGLQAVPMLLQVSDIDSGREARVLRYREKRRTRLFSKKIRYEVRKLNAERRPRMKGRFVKRTTIATIM